MKWSAYYEKFYEWAESTQLSRISALDDFGPMEELIEIAEELGDKGAARLIARAKKQGVVFGAKDVVALCEFVPEQTLITLITECKEPFTPDEFVYLQDYSMLHSHEIKAHMTYPLAMGSISFEEYMEIFDDLTEEEQQRSVFSIVDFSSLKDQNWMHDFYDIVLSMSEEDATRLVVHGLQHGLILDATDITEIASNIDTTLLSELMEGTRQSFTYDQLEDMTNSNSLDMNELQQLVNQEVIFSPLTWQAYLERFDELTDDNKLLAANAINDFSKCKNFATIAVQLDLIGDIEAILTKALNQGIKLTVNDIRALIELDYKGINERLIFGNLKKLKNAFCVEEFLTLESYMHRRDFKKLLRKLNIQISKPYKPGIIATIGAIAISNKVFDFIFGVNRDEK